MECADTLENLAEMYRAQYGKTITDLKKNVAGLQESVKVSETSLAKCEKELEEKSNHNDNAPKSCETELAAQKAEVEVCQERVTSLSEKVAVTICQDRNEVVEKDNKDLRSKNVVLKSDADECREELAAQKQSSTKLTASASCESELLEGKKVCDNKLRAQEQACKTTEIQLTENLAVCESQLEEQYDLANQASKACDDRVKEANNLCAEDMTMFVGQAAAMCAEKTSSLERELVDVKANAENKIKHMQEQLDIMQEDLKFTREKLHEEREKNQRWLRFPNLKKLFGDKSKALMKWVEQKWNRMFNRGSNAKNTDKSDKKDKKGGEKKEKDEEPKKKPWWRIDFSFGRNKDKDNNEGHKHISREK